MVSLVAAQTFPFEYIAVHDVFVNLPAGLASFPLSLSGSRIWSSNIDRQRLTGGRFHFRIFVHKSPV